MLWIACEGFVKGRQRIGKAALVVENVAAKKQRLEICWLELQKYVASCERLVKTADLLQRCSRTVECFAISWDKPKRGLEAFASLGVLAAER